MKGSRADEMEHQRNLDNLKKKISRPTTPSMRKKNPFDPKGNPVFFFTPVGHKIVEATKLLSFEDRVNEKVKERERNLGNVNMMVRSSSLGEMNKQMRRRPISAI
jgi:ribonuclease BN (tRNA processing enzyme)